MNLRITLLCSILPIALFMGGCATPSNPAAMTVMIAPVQHTSAKSSSVTVLGGRETSKAGASQISNADFAKALEQSLLNSKVFSGIQSNGDYELEAYIGMLQQPFMGLDMTVKMEVSYTLKNRASSEVIWTKNIASDFTATVGDAFAGVKRLRLANEGAARTNIEQLINELSKLNL